MPQPSIGSPPTQIWDLEVTGPVLRTDDIPPLALATNLQRAVITHNTGRSYSENAGVIGVATAIGGSGSGTIRADITPAFGFPFYHLTSPVAGDRRENTFPGFGGPVVVNPTAVLAPGATMPSLMRVLWLSALIRAQNIASLNATENAGVVLQPMTNDQRSWPGDPVGVTNRGGMAIVGNGAGQWQHVSFNRAGILLQRYAVALPVHNTENWNLAEWVITGARPGQPATFEFWFNGQLVTTRSWLGADLELPQGQESRWYPCLASDDQIGISAVFHLRMGRYTKTGIEIV
jgi:hypothetical protein